MAKKKTTTKKQKEPKEIIKEGGFEFRVFDNETEVLQKRKPLGTIVGMKERNGRHCFRLGCDERKTPRTYRGRLMAAEALLAIEGLVRDSKKGRWKAEEFIIRCWDAKPHASPRQG